jgi:hypothetical protein
MDLNPAVVKRWQNEAPVNTVEMSIVCNFQQVRWDKKIVNCHFGEWVGPNPHELGNQLISSLSPPQCIRG